MPRDSIEVIRMKGATAAFGDARSEEFGKSAEAAPFALRSLGLGSGLAALAAKSGQGHKDVAEMIAAWLISDHAPFTLPKGEGNPETHAVKEALRRIATCSRSDYRKAQTEALGYAGWIKKLAQAFCEKPE